MKVLYFGDVFGKPGRQAVRTAMGKLLNKHGIDFVVLNGENASHGRGILPEVADEFFSLGVDCITTGNHAWDQPQIIPYMKDSEKIIRPLNYPDTPSYPCPGRGSTIIESLRKPGLKLGVIQVMGRVFMEAIDCPFRAAEKEWERLRGLGIKPILIDFHGEASSEKQAFAYFMDGRASAVLGSHAHVQTADERIMPGGTAAITDVGMCGCFDSVIGVKKEMSIQRFLTKRPARFEPAEGPGGYGAVIVEISEATGKATSILRLREVIAN